ncbi:hypothetical protein [Flavobacterium sp. UBA6195]|uniref:hypothetical protein n=1 Tax=Flavobacterium sp. UBA6195 TaxID=1946554 RepID=UPI0025BE4F65|nr:hypothetical protein [Flavobacterium sp. UBA6195]
MSKFNEQIQRILWWLCAISILCYISYYFYKSSNPIGVLEYLWLGVKSIFTTILSLLILMSIIDFLSILLERKYYKANITSSKMNNLKIELKELEKKYNQIKNRTDEYKRHNLRNDEVKKLVYKKLVEKEKEIQYITDENISFYIKDKLNLHFFSEGVNKLGCLGIGYFMYFIILIVNTPKRFFEIYEFVETRNWFAFSIILIAGISIFVYKLIRPHKVVKFITSWIFSIAILTVFLYFSKPSYIDIYTIDELLWAVGCLGFISSLSILTAKAFE